MKRASIAVVLLALSACGSGLPDQGTIDVCTSIIGFEIPKGAGLGPAGGWYAVAQAGTSVAKNPSVRAASADVLRNDTPYLLRHGFNDKQRVAYVASITRMSQACKQSGAYKGKATHLYGN